ncbi:MAG: beta-xylosidase, partial [Burkholderiales bacterium]|nr:beta-xylosidase [Phycisphaerae bacterium]
LLPIEWVDGWPIIGKRGEDGIGNMIWTAKKPIPGPVVKMPAINEDFSSPKLAVHWQWNYQPRMEKWSLTEHPGFLRLHAFKPLRNNELLKAGNTLTQRCLRTDANEVMLKLDLTGMADGQEAGLCHFAGAYSALSISQAGDVRKVTYNERGKITEGPVLEGTDVWIKSTWGIDGESEYSYSTDGRSFKTFGNRWKLTWGNYRGDRIGIFSYNNKADAGHVDVDSFQYTFGKRKP